MRFGSPLYGYVNYGNGEHTKENYQDATQQHTQRNPRNWIPFIQFWRHVLKPLSEEHEWNHDGQEQKPATCAVRCNW
jgi:hypothetical protein